MSEHGPDTEIPNWPAYFMGFAKLAATRSKDPNTKVGAVVVSKDRHVLATGYNGLVKGINDNIAERWSRVDGEKYHWCEHAERNAIYVAARKGIALENSTMFTTLLPCMDCARAIVQSGIVAVTTDRKEFNKRAGSDDKWRASHKRTLTLFEEAGVSLTWLEEEEDENR